MTRSTSRLVAASTAVGIVLAATACSSGSADPDGGTPGNDPSATTSIEASPAATPVDPCTGDSSCVWVANADIDGDGTLDTIGVADHSESPTEGTAFGAGRITVSARIDGRVVRTSLTPSAVGYTPSEMYRGAYAMSRSSGNDVVLHLWPGQGGAEQFAVISWDGSTLAPLDQPPTADETGARSPGVWYLRSSHGLIDFVTCRQPGEIAVNTLTAATAEGMPVPGGGRREDNYFLFAGSGWQPNGSDNVVDNSFSYRYDAHTSAFRCDDHGQRRV